MLLAHFAAALVAKSVYFPVPLSVYLFASLFPNILRSILSLVGLEREGIHDASGRHVLGAFQRLFMRAHISHSVVSLLIFACCAALVPFLAYLMFRGFSPKGDVSRTVRGGAASTGTAPTRRQRAIDAATLAENGQPAFTWRFNPIITESSPVTLLKVSAALAACILVHLILDAFSHGEYATLYWYPRMFSAINKPLQTSVSLYRALPASVVILFELFVFLVAFTILRQTHGLRLHQALLEVHEHLDYTRSASTRTDSPSVSLQCQLLVRDLYALWERATAACASLTNVSSLNDSMVALDFLGAIFLTVYGAQLVMIFFFSERLNLLFSILQLVIATVSIRFAYDIVDMVFDTQYEEFSQDNTHKELDDLDIFTEEF